MPGFVAQAVLENERSLRSEFGKHQDTLKVVDKSHDYDNCFPIADWLSLAATTQAWKPDLVIELGRGNGASTAMFASIGVKVLSCCWSDHWEQQTIPALETYDPTTPWRDRVKAIVGDITAQDWPALVGHSKRPLIFWDAHGHEVAERVFASILPALSGRETFVACHDIRDHRYFRFDGVEGYDNRPLWRAGYYGTERWLRIGHAHASYEQLIPILDFCSRNDISLHSASHDLGEFPQTLRFWEGSGAGFWPAVYWHYFIVPAEGVGYPAPGL